MTRAPGIDLLRACAIAAVMLYHVSSHGIPTPALVEHGWMGVDLFFVLSGYLIGWQLLRAYAQGEQPQWRRFMVHRALRILPAYYAVLALYVMLPSPEGGALQPLWKYLTFTLNLAPDWRQGAAYSHAWSLCVEEHFYLLFPLAAWLLARRLNARRAIMLAVALVAGGMLLRGWLWHTRVEPLLASDAGAAMHAFISMIYNPTYARLDGLLMGVSLAACRAFRPAWWNALLRHGRILLAAGIVVLAACTQIALDRAAGTILMFPLVALGCTLLLAGAISPATWIGRHPVPGARPLAMLAFSLYLTHKQVYAWLDGLLPALGQDMPLAALAVYLAASLAAAALLYFAVERPGLRLRSAVCYPQPSSIHRAPS
jgi:peptidoglycan/LPS O-acetylase OafA/YrhL